MTWTVEQTPVFEAWLRGLRDTVTRAIIARRIERVAAGNLGDVKPVGDGLSELRIDHGPGFRVYFVRRGERVIVLLCWG
jgi:putative addiction module killer protein